MTPPGVTQARRTALAKRTDAPGFGREKARGLDCPPTNTVTGAYLFGAICPMQGKGAALMLPYVDTEAMQLHVEEIGSRVAKGARGVVIMDRAGWHRTPRLKVPANLTIILLPSRSPEPSSRFRDPTRGHGPSSVSRKYLAAPTAKLALEPSVPNTGRHH